MLYSTQDLKGWVARMSVPETMKRARERSPEERKKRMAEIMTMQAKKYGFDDAEAFGAALKKYQDEDEVKELMGELEKFRKNVSSGKQQKFGVRKTKIKNNRIYIYFAYHINI